MAVKFFCVREPRIKIEVTLYYRSMTARVSHGYRHCVHDNIKYVIVHYKRTSYRTMNINSL